MKITENQLTSSDVRKPIPEALYSCGNSSCAEECSYPADMLFWSEQEQMWLCDCCWTMADEERGISLAEEIKRRVHQ